MLRLAVRTLGRFRLLPEAQGDALLERALVPRHEFEPEHHCLAELNAQGLHRK